MADDTRHATPAEGQAAPSQWEQFIPWYLTAISCLLLIGLGIFMLENILWMRDHMFAGAGSADPSYRSHQYFLLISTVRRSAGLFAGISLMLLGVGIVFYVARTQSKLDMSLHGASLGIVSASPGLIAMALGTFLIAHNTASKDLVPIFGNSATAPDDLRDAMDRANELLEDMSR